MDKVSKFITRIHRLEVADLGDRETIKVKVTNRLKKWERLIFRLATILKWPLCFGAPVAVIAFVFLILVCMYNVGPYNSAKHFKETSCSIVNISSYTGTITCQYRRPAFLPCRQIWVKYNHHSEQVYGILMEDEHSNNRCNKCSYTNGHGRLFSSSQSCTWNDEITAEECTSEYFAKFQRLVNSTITCYYDPEIKADVIVNKETTTGQMVYQLGLPIVYLIIFLAGLGILIYAYIRKRFILQKLLAEEEEKQALNGEVKSVDNEDLPLTATSCTVIKRKKKKKLPCCRSHNFFGLEEAIVLEQKPISPSQGDQHSSSVNVELQPYCLHHQNTSVGSWGFERINQNEDDLRPVMSAFDGMQPSSSRLFRYLPESVV